MIERVFVSLVRMILGNVKGSRFLSLQSLEHRQLGSKTEKRRTKEREKKNKEEKYGKKREK